MDDWIKEAAAGLIGNVLLSNKLRQTLDVRVLTPEEVEQQEEIQKRWYTDFRIKHQLELEGYKVIRIWEHDIIKKDFDIMKFLEGVELNAISK